MTNVTRVLSGVAFTLVLALSLMATSSEAYAKGRAGSAQPVTANTTAPATISPTGAFHALGVTWE